MVSQTFLRFVNLEGDNVGNKQLLALTPVLSIVDWAEDSVILRGLHVSRRISDKPHIAKQI